MLTLVWLVYASFGFTTGSLAPLVEPVLDDLRMTSSQMGLVLGAWQLVYIASASPLGALVDRLGPRRAIGIGMLIGWLSLVLRGLSPNFPVLFLVVALFGVGGPVISIGAPKVVSQWFSGNQRGVAAGVYATAPVTGNAFAFFTAANVVEPLFGGWRGISVFYGVIMAAILLAWWLLARDAPPGSEAAPTAKPGERVRSSFRELLGNHTVRVVLLLAFGTFLLNHGLNNWLPTLLRERGFSLGSAGTWVATATLVSTGGILLFPSLARRAHRVRVLALMLAGTTLTTVGLAAFDGGWLIATMFVSNIVRTPTMAVLTLVLMETKGVGSARMGAAAGLFFAAAEVGGFSGPLFLGAVRQGTGELAWGIYAFAVVALAMLLLMRLLRERGQPA
ncbi:MAG: MFS transporter [SAR202 cluster bacterium]|nr:MFS transporter [SAR202 cluster bacterium]